MEQAWTEFGFINAYLPLALVGFVFACLFPVHVSMCVSACMCLCVCVCLFPVHVSMCVSACMCMCVCVCVCVHAHVHAV